LLRADDLLSVEVHGAPLGAEHALIRSAPPHRTSQLLVTPPPRLGEGVLPSSQLTFNVSDSVLSVSGLCSALVVLAKTLLGFIQPKPINILVLARIEALDQTKGEPGSVTMRQPSRLLFNA
jgi:hypothetical protein